MIDCEFTYKENFHAKTLTVDNKWVVFGSFGWLSVMRDEYNQYSYLEHSVLVRNGNADRLITQVKNNLSNNSPSEKFNINELCFFSDAALHRNFLYNCLAHRSKSSIIIYSPYIKTDGIKIFSEASVKHVPRKLFAEAIVRGVTLNICESLEKEKVKGNVKSLLEEQRCTFSSLPRVHAKPLIIDDTYLVIGSFNWLSTQPGKAI